MRTIKFRGKGFYDGRWYYGDLIHDENLTSINFIVDNPDMKSIEMVVIPETVGQFTGLTDKNGVEIYEGDIIKINDFEDEFGIKYHWAVGVVQIIPDISSKNVLSFIKHVPYSEIIGNIHDNPELLK